MNILFSKKKEKTMSFTSFASPFRTDAYITTFPERPNLLFWKFPEPFTQRVFNPGFDFVQRDPWNKVLYTERIPQDSRILGESNDNQMEPMVHPFKSAKGITQAVLKI